MGKTSAAVKNRYNEKAYDRIALMLPKGSKERLKEEAEKRGFKSINALVSKALEDFLKK